MRGRRFDATGMAQASGSFFWLTLFMICSKTTSSNKTRMRAISVCHSGSRCWQQAPRRVGQSAYRPHVCADWPSQRLCGSSRIFMATGKMLEEFGMTSFSSIPSKARCPEGPGPDAIDVFPSVIRNFLNEYRPSRMPFFRHMANLPFPVASDPTLLGQIHLIYQSAMHTTRAAVYYLPHLDSPALRKRKLQILIDDDGLPAGDTHHYQLTRAFLNIGAKSLLADEEFADPETLCDWPENYTCDRSVPGVRSRSCRSTGCEPSPRPFRCISQSSSMSPIFGSVSHRGSKSVTRMNR